MGDIRKQRRFNDQPSRTRTLTGKGGRLRIPPRLKARLAGSVESTHPRSASASNEITTRPSVVGATLVLARAGTAGTLPAVRDKPVAYAPVPCTSAARPRGRHSASAACAAAPAPAMANAAIAPPSRISARDEGPSG